PTPPPPPRPTLFPYTTLFRSHVRGVPHDATRSVSAMTETVARRGREVAEVGGPLRRRREITRSPIHRRSSSHQRTSEGYSGRDRAVCSPRDAKTRRRIGLAPLGSAREIGRAHV